MCDFSNYSTKSNHYDDSNKLVVVKMKTKTGDAAIEKFFRLKPKMYSLLVNDSNEHQKAKSLDKNVVATISQNCNLNNYSELILNQSIKILF